MVSLPDLRTVRALSRSRSAACRYLTLSLACLVAVLLAPAAGRAAESVAVGGYAFPPYVTLSHDGQPSGLTLDLLDALNRSQTRYDFRFMLTSPTRRYRDFETGRFDAMIFEMPEWGWEKQNVPLAVSEPIASDSEVYIAQARPGRDQTYFDDFGTRRIAGILGYNYGFTGFRNDPAELRRRFDIVLVNDHTATIELVLRERVDLGVVTESFLTRYLDEHPAARPILLVSARKDQVYAHRVLTRPGTDPSAADIAALVLAAPKQGALATFWQRHGLKP